MSKSLHLIPNPYRTCLPRDAPACSIPIALAGKKDVFARFHGRNGKLAAPEASAAPADPGCHQGTVPQLSSNARSSNAGKRRVAVN